MITKSQAENGLNLNIHRLSMDIDHLTNKLLKKSEVSLTNSQYLVLKTIFINSDSSQKEIAQFLNISEPAVSRHVKKLVKMGYLSCDITRNKEKKIRLSSQGEEIFKKAFELLYKELKVYIKNYERVSDEILETLKGLLSK